MAALCMMIALIYARAGRGDLASGDRILNSRLRQ